jgi:uncharacterized repeat protein (TIGR03803 family)
MKSRTLMCITAITLFAALGVPHRLAAQEQQEQAATFTVLHAFTGLSGGQTPSASLARDNAGNLYGTTRSGGDLACGSGFGCGVVFKLDTTGRETVLHRFTGGKDGSTPSASLVRDNAGNLYGTAVSGGDLACGSGSGCGVVFKLGSTGGETVLHKFTGGADGSFPNASLVRDNAGNLYSTAASGGDLACGSGSGCGVVFKLDITGRETVLHSFTGGKDGAFPAGPAGGLVRDAAGNLYGTTQLGGDLACGNGKGCGVVFELDATGRETVLHSFTGGADGSFPNASLVRDNAGNLYGTQLGAGGIGSGGGVVFKLGTTGRETVLHSFTGGANGSFPNASLVRDNAGNLYGTTQVGGDLACGSGFGCGVVFKLGSTGVETVLHRFTGGKDGAFPMGGLVRDNAGNLYGTSGPVPGVSGGVVFKLTP